MKKCLVEQNHVSNSSPHFSQKREERDGISPAIPPAIKRTNLWLVSKIYSAEHLPVMDASRWKRANREATIFN